ncbi:MAG: hypothetical protein VYB37_00010 [Pseudomonadota bacterium]|nr:hypothetical protein [Pseudomonadota bacterium]
MRKTQSKKRVAVLVIHGIGAQRRDFAEPLIKGVNREVRGLGCSAQSIAWQSVFWDDLLAPRQSEYLQRAMPHGRLNYRRLRKFVVAALGDAGAYRQRPSGSGFSGDLSQTYQQVHRRIEEAMSELYNGPLAGRPLPLVLLAHSFGGHILSNYVWDSQTRPDRRLSPFERMNWLSGFVTFGCNIPLFTFAVSDPVPIRFPAPKLPKRFRARARWLNFYDPDDVLGWPLQPVSATYARAVDADVRLQVGGLAGGWTPAAHLLYWRDQKFASEVAALLATFLVPDE